MNLEARHRAACTLSMVEADLQAVNKRLSLSFGPEDTKVRQLEKAADLIEGVKSTLIGGRTNAT
ncbi:hypothetical protein [Marispirochaeta sp.]|uniref:hypothetical protein n=1 Tax=Marispirochaeta sp. TaxID=2038653 RepID=UPI0029C723CE|nr:hypothetical protein [Marispirochaeta sp.]